MAYISCLRELNASGKLSSLEIIKGDGELSVFSGDFLSEEIKREVYLHTYFLITGIFLISEQYPDYVRLGSFSENFKNSRFRGEIKSVF